ncbi:hypothetical protein B0T16DRAFT_449737 [Cercophora newfieldiana]|uniref:Uncharacterized protein n=1 Tax=Cercophora newfieldiana TaxID=92897 RepID=A0AA39XTL4_9PEZI|nr:hypothetical protein B0T16DRAFT_449737 [Cercophora newfieldiana]
MSTATVNSLTATAKHSMAAHRATRPLGQCLSLLLLTARHLLAAAVAMKTGGGSRHGAFLLAARLPPIHLVEDPQPWNWQAYEMLLAPNARRAPSRSGISGLAAAATMAVSACGGLRQHSAAQQKKQKPDPGSATQVQGTRCSAQAEEAS